jgi:uncharacterized protein with GYD domain
MKTGSDQAVGRHRSLKAAPDLCGAPATSESSKLACRASGSECLCIPRKDDMATFLFTIDWTDQGIRAVKDAPKRSEAAKELATKLGVDIKQIYLTSGAHDLLVIVEAPLGDNISKFALALSSLGNVRTTTSRAWTEPEWKKLISELP